MTHGLTRRQWMASAAAGAAQVSRPPNVLLIITDQQHVQALSAAGNPYVRTPNMDRLARAGTRFANSWCTNPVCSPARASLLTGCMPNTAGVEYLGRRLKPDVQTIGEAFAAAGYETAWAGKWHVPAPFPGAVTPDGPPPLARERGFDFLQFPVVSKSRVGLGDFTDDSIARASAAFIKQKRDRPLLLGVSVHNPHDICYWIAGALPDGHPSLGEMTPPERELPRLPRNFAPPAEPEFISRCRGINYFGGEARSPTADWDESQWRRYLYAYYRMTERVDRSIGLVLDAMRASGQEDNTIVAFTSDHGEGLGAHRWVMKLMLYEEPLSVPLIFSWKGRIAAGREDRRTLASGMDVMPTLCDLAGVPVPRTVQGVSLRGALDGSGKVSRDSIFAQLAPAMKDRSLQGRAVRSQAFKYVSFSSGARPEMLFHLEDDPGETRNLAALPKFRNELERHHALLSDWVKRIGDTYERS